MTVRRCKRSFLAGMQHLFLSRTCPERIPIFVAATKNMSCDYLLLDLYRGILQSLFMTEKAGSSPEVVRHVGACNLYLGMHQGVVSMADEASKDAKKNVLKAAGISWAATFAHQLCNAQRGYQKQDITYAALAGHAAMAALCLWRGFAEDED